MCIYAQITTYIFIYIYMYIYVYIYIHTHTCIYMSIPRPVATRLATARHCFSPERASHGELHGPHHLYTADVGIRASVRMKVVLVKLTRTKRRMIRLVTG